MINNYTTDVVSANLVLPIYLTQKNGCKTIKNMDFDRVYNS